MIKMSSTERSDSQLSWLSKFDYHSLLCAHIFFSIDILLDTHLNSTKPLSPGTNILRVPGKNKKKFLIKKTN